MKLPSILNKHLGRQKETYTDKLTFPLEQWLRYFFEYALEKKKNFYWAWNSFMVVVRRHRNKTVMVLEISLRKAPFLVQKHIDITTIPDDVLVNSLLFLYNHYPSSPSLRRNREHSTRFLSFISFLQMIDNHDIKKLPYDDKSSTKINRLLVAYVMKTLDFYDTPPVLKRPEERLYNVSQLLRNGSLKT